MKHEITRETILRIQVCSEGTEDEALEWLRDTHAAGTTGNWQHTDKPELAPVKCKDQEIE